MTPTLAHRTRATEHGELELLARARRGDVAAFEELAGAHTSRLFVVVTRLVDDRVEAEDVVQESLLRAWRGICEFRGRSGFSTWLHRIAVNEANRSLMQSTHRRETIRLSDEQPRFSAPADDGPTRQAELHELRAALRTALLALPLPYRTAVVLRDIEGLPTREAAHIAGVGERAFKSRLHHARVQIRAALGDQALIAAAS
jgi:RNA polymerase sigma-70 factor (ECF subfamily)